jgi:hypothetical protein
MTKEEQQLFCADLCARLPYEVKVEYRGEPITLDYALFAKEYSLAFGQYPMKFNLDKLDTIKPYLRPMESLTEKERSELRQWGCLCMTPDDFVEDVGVYGAIHSIPVIDWLNAHHFDYRGLIKKGLALEAPEGMYESKK